MGGTTSQATLTSEYCPGADTIHHWTLSRRRGVTFTKGDNFHKGGQCSLVNFVQGQYFLENNVLGDNQGRTPTRYDNMWHCHSWNLVINGEVMRWGGLYGHLHKKIRCRLNLTQFNFPSSIQRSIPRSFLNHLFSELEASWQVVPHLSWVHWWRLILVASSIGLVWQVDTA